MRHASKAPVTLISMGRETKDGMATGTRPVRELQLVGVVLSTEEGMVRDQLTETRKRRVLEHWELSRKSLRVRGALARGH
jgi:hypothetical protein